MVENWTILLQKLDTLLDEEQISFMKPDDYVHLLYDDASFSRSRFYFWAIGCMLTFDGSLSGNIETLASCQSDEFWFLNVDAAVREKCKEELLRYRLELVKLREHVRGRLDNVKSLRDGVRTVLVLPPYTIVNIWYSFSAPVV
jgi:hypothetical protein